MDVFDEIFANIVLRLKRQKYKKKYIHNNSTNKKNKKNGINCKQAKFRPDVTITHEKSSGTQKKRSRYSGDDDFNEFDR